MSTTIYLIEKISDDEGNETVRDNAHDLATRWWNGRAFAYTLHPERWGEFEIRDFARALVKKSEEPFARMDDEKLTAAQFYDLVFAPD